MSDPVPSFPDEENRKRIRAIFRSAGFDDATFRSALGLAPHAPLAGIPFPVFREALGSLNPVLRCLSDWFFAEETLAEESLEKALCHHVLGDLQAAGLVVPTPEGYRGTVHLKPFGEVLLASDRRERHIRREADMVPGPGGPTRTLLEFTLPGPVESVLDLGCGPGGLGLRAGVGGARVVSTDINPRALAFTRFNASLNGREDVDCREGSLFEPVAGERFDRILCNPPYALSPAHTFLYRDGQEGIVQTILGEAPGYLTQGGSLQMMAEWPEPSEGDWRKWIQEWCRDVDADVYVLRLYSYGNDRYAWTWLVQEYGEEPVPQEVFQEWTTFLREAGVGSVGGGHVVVRRPGSHERMRILRQAPGREKGWVGDSLLRWIETQETVVSMGDQELLDLRLSAGPGLEREDRRVPGGDGWAPGTSNLRLRSGLCFGARVDPVGAAVVGLLDGRRTPREALALFCKESPELESAFLPGLPRVLRSLLALGLLTPVLEERPANEG